MSGSEIPAAAIPAVEVLSAEKTYPGGTQALLPVDLRIEEGDIVVIFALTSDVPEVERLLQVSIDFF